MDVLAYVAFLTRAEVCHTAMQHKPVKKSRRATNANDRTPTIGIIYAYEPPTFIMGSMRFERRISASSLANSELVETISLTDETNVISDDESDVTVPASSSTSTSHATPASARTAHVSALHDAPDTTAATAAAIVCDSCQYCNDVCHVPNCVKCQSKTSSQGRHEQQRGHYTMCQIRRHNSIDNSVWIIADDTVYDVTSYVQYHPGGMECILKKAGGKYNCSRDLRFHSHRGQQLFSKYAIGKVISCPGCASPATTITTNASATTATSRPSVLSALEQHRWFLW